MPLFALAAGLGALSGTLFSKEPLLIAGITLSLFLFSLFLLFFRLLFSRSLILIFLFLFASLFSLSFLEIKRISSFPFSLEEKFFLTCEGMLTSKPVMKEWKLTADVELHQCALDGGIKRVHTGARLSLSKENADLLPGERIKFKARFFPPREYKNPGGFSYRTYLLVHGVGVVGKVSGEVERLEGGSWLRETIARMRMKVAEAVSMAAEEEVRAVLTAFALIDAAQHTLPLDVRELEADDLTDPQPCGIGRHE